MFYFHWIVECHKCGARQAFEAYMGSDYPSLEKQEGNIELPAGWKWRTFKGAHMDPVYEDRLPMFPRGVFCPKCVEEDSTR